MLIVKEQHAWKTFILYDNSLYYKAKCLGRTVSTISSAIGFHGRYLALI
jgi:hypothetical protein